MEFVLIQPGTFMMGSDDYKDEQPVHQVTISKPFYMGQNPVTQEEWNALMESNPSRFKGNRLPVEQVCWHDAIDFIQKLNERKRCSGCHRLPTEAEWEYATRAGTTTAHSFGDDSADLGNDTWYWKNVARTT